MQPPQSYFVHIKNSGHTQILSGSAPVLNVYEPKRLSIEVIEQSLNERLTLTTENNTHVTVYSGHWMRSMW